MHTAGVSNLMRRYEFLTGPRKGRPLGFDSQIYLGSPKVSPELVAKPPVRDNWAPLEGAECVMPMLNCE